MKVIGYTYEADIHCPDCTEARFSVGYAKHPFITIFHQIDNCGVPYNSRDNEGNLVHPIFSTDEIEHDSACSNCGTFIN